MMIDKATIEKKLIEFEELAKQVKVTNRGLKALEPLEEEIGKALKEYLRNAKEDKDFEFIADVTHRIIEAKRLLYS